MKREEALRLLSEIVDDTNVGVLTTVENGYPRARWMTVGILKGRPGALFSVTIESSPKLKQIAENPNVEWLLQSRNLDRIINVRGKVNVIDNPALRAEVLESIGGKLTTLWKIRHDHLQKLLVLETVIEEMAYFIPLKGELKVARFNGGESE
ncbi:MAG: pyridoxamine 5-phosphate oxidase [Thermotogota bacterium]|nr:pyridoxamine 5-phosphate oxidase [Thermotogota bacterium]HCZ06968.1 pyridoxamine 5'-phosphate oxidase [Thermotogota bacterium]